MKKVKYFIFGLICLFSCSMVYAESEVVIKSITPVYDEESSVVVTETDGKHNVVFNDKDQSVKYNVVIENTTSKDLSVQSIKLTTPSEDFLKYELEGLNSADVIKANSTKEVVISLNTVKQDGWGRNFDDDLTATINFGDPIGNPNTKVGDTVTWVIIIAGASALGMVVTIIAMVKTKNKKIVGILVLTIALGSLIPMAKAQETIAVPIKINVAYKSQNVMKPSECDVSYGYDYNCSDYWYYGHIIQNIYVQNEVVEIPEFKYKYDVSDKQNGRVMAYLVENSNSVCYDEFDGIEKNCLDLYLQADGIIHANENASAYFYNMALLEDIHNLGGLDFNNVTDMSYMFYNTGRNNPNFTLDLGDNFDTSNVTNMDSMFDSTGSGSTNFTLNLGEKFDTSNVTNMYGMFYSTGSGSTNLTIDLGDNFETSKVTNMSYMFRFTGYNSTSLIIDLGEKFDTSNVTDMYSMFEDAGYNSTTFTLDLGDNFDTSNVTNMDSMFKNTGRSSTNFTLDLGDKFDTSNVTNMQFMFDDTGYNSTIFTLDLGDKFDTSNVNNMGCMFRNTGYNSTIFTLDLGDNFDTSKVTRMTYMFSGTGHRSSNFTLDLGDNFDTSNVTDMSYMFSGTGYASPNFTLDLGDKFDTSNVTNMSYMFEGTGFMNPNFTLDLGDNFDTSKVTNMRCMFQNTGYSSTKLNVIFTIKKKLTSSKGYNNIFTGVATKEGSQITVNYTSANSSYINMYIATKSANSNVVKGVQVD